MTTRVILVTGGGGVGKTTLSAAIGVAAAERGRRTLVLTVDPAKRLADALGLDGLGAEPQPNKSVPGLWAAMLDAEKSWHNIVRRHSPPDVAARLEENEFFEAISARFPASQAYAAGEEMMNYLDAKVWEILVVDTPPSAGGIGFFTAPGDIRDLIGGKLIRFLTGSRVPGRRTVYSVAGKPVLKLADSILGSDLLQRVAEFLMDLRTTYDGLSRRAKAIERTFKRATTLVVTTAEPTPLREAAQFYRELPAVASTPATVVFNRTLPQAWTDPPADPPTDPKLPAALTANLQRWAAEAHHQMETRREFADRYDAAISSIPWQPTAPTDPASLLAMLNAAEGLDLDDLLSR